MFIKAYNKRIGIILGVFLLTLLALFGYQQASTTDEDDQATNDEDVNSSDEALPFERVVVDSPAIAHYMSLYDIPLVGIPTTEKPMPEEYEGITEIGIAVKPNIETIVSLDPDLFIENRVLEQFSKDQVENHGIETLYIDNSSYEAVYDSILEVGELMGLEAKGNAFIAEQKDLESEILKRTEELKGKKSRLSWVRLNRIS